VAELSDEIKKFGKELTDSAEKTFDAFANTLEKAGSKIAKFVKDPKVRECMATFGGKFFHNLIGTKDGDAKEAAKEKAKGKAKSSHSNGR